ncbi:glycosyl transferase [Komagataeibacter sp. FXV2]|nr:glycosyl transferase [Komagataeibacter sp. FXV2]
MHRSLPFMVLLVAIGAVSMLLVRIMVRVRVLDHPVARSAHSAPVPTGGGIGIMAAFMAGMPVAGAIWGSGTQRPASGHFGTAGFIGALALLCLVSWYDDLRPRPVAVKLLAQFAAAMVIVACLPPLATTSTAATLLLPIGSVVWLVFMANCVNFMDGMNGLVSGTSLCACLMLPWLAPAPVAATVIPIAGSMAAAIAGFLPFNFPRARIFMGDVGSQGCGMVLGTLGLLLAHGGDGGWAVMPLLMSGLLCDVTFTLLRRWRAGESIVTAHRGHLYQVAHRSGLPCTLLSPLAWGMCLWGGALAWLLRHGGIPAWAAFALAAGTQAAWAGYVRHRVRTHPVGRW